MSEPKRHKNKSRNLILNRAVTDLERIINQHDPETDVPIKRGVWGRLDKLALEIETLILPEDYGDDVSPGRDVRHRRLAAREDRQESTANHERESHNEN